MRIELKGWSGFAWKICDLCPCLRENYGQGACFLGHLDKDVHQENGLLNNITGEVIAGKLHEDGYSSDDDWYEVIVRPQVCIDKQGR